MLHLNGSQRAHEDPFKSLRSWQHCWWNGWNGESSKWSATQSSNDFAVYFLIKFWPGFTMKTKKNCWTQYLASLPIIQDPLKRWKPWGNLDGTKNSTSSYYHVDPPYVYRIPLLPNFIFFILTIPQGTYDTLGLSSVQHNGTTTMNEDVSPIKNHRRLCSTWRIIPGRTQAVS